MIARSFDLPHPLRDPLHYRVQAFAGLRIAKAQESDPQRLDIPLTLPVVLGRPAPVMTLPVDLDGQPELGAVEIEHVAADAVLPAKSVAKELPVTEPEP